MANNVQKTILTDLYKISQPERAIRMLPKPINKCQVTIPKLSSPFQTLKPL